MFDPSKLPASDGLKQLIGDAVARIAEVDKRERRRRAVDQVNHERAVSALVCDLVHREFSEPSSWLMVPLAKSSLASRSRAAPFMTETFADTVKLLRTAGIADLYIGEMTQLGGVQSTMRAGPWLLERIEPGDFDFGDIGRDPALLGDPLVLRSVKAHGKAHNLRLPDTDEVRQLRHEMETINAWIAQADLQWICEPLDIGKRHLTRIFNDGSLQRGGRMFHGFWIDAPKEDRLDCLRINGERIASLDFGQVAVRVAYATVGAVPPKGDLYSVSVPGPREGVKQVVNALFAWDTPLTRFPRKARRLFPRSVKFGDVLSAISRRHPALVPLFGSAQALVQQNAESRVIVRSLLTLRELGIVALPIHDSLLVGVSHISVAKEVLERTFKEITGVEGCVDTEGGGPIEPIGVSRLSPIEGVVADGS